MRSSAFLIALITLVVPCAAANDDGAVQITFDPANDYDPTWSPDCTQIAFTSNRNGSNGIWVIPATGGLATEIVTGGREPAWSPDGSLIAFVACWGCLGPDIWVVSVADGATTQITEDYDAEYDDFAPCWSPDGRFIVFSSNRSGGYHLYIMNGNGYNQRRIIYFKGEEEAPSWSPF